jgi:hypothetical protein
LETVYLNATSGATELFCLNSSYCKPAAKYLMLRGNSTFHVTNSFSFPDVIEWINGSIERKTIPLPIEFLFHTMAPNSPSISWEHCSYVLLPNQLMRRIDARRSLRSRGWHAFHVNISWPPQNYPASHDSFDYTDLLRSTYPIPHPFPEVIDFQDMKRDSSFISALDAKQMKSKV